MPFHKLLETDIKPLGKWQIMSFLLMAIPSNMPSTLIPQFANLHVDHVCGSPWNSKWSYNEVFNFSTSLHTRYKNQTNLTETADIVCSRISYEGLEKFGENLTYAEAMRLMEENATPDNFTLEKCDGPWVYDSLNAPYRRSLIEDFDLVCDRRYYIPYSASWHSVGQSIGCFFGGQIADRYGRKNIMCFVYPFTAILFILIYWCWSYWIFIIFRILSGIAWGIGYNAAYILILEMTNEKHRNTFCVVEGILYYVVCSNFNVLFSYLLQDWRWIHLTFGIVYLISFSYPFLLTESPLWLIAKGRYEEALKIVRKAIIMNGGSIQQAKAVTIEALMPVIQSDDEIQEENKNKESWTVMVKSVVLDWVEFFTTPSLIRNWLPLTWFWIVSLGVFYGIVFYSTRLPWNPYIIAVVLSLVTVPIKLPQWYLYHRFDRKRPLVAFTYLSGVLCLAAFLTIYFDANTVVILVFAVCAYCVISAAFDMMYLYTPEIFPTLYRSKALGYLQAVSNLGTFAGNYVERLDEFVWKPLPMLVFGAATVTAGLCLSITKDSGDLTNKRLANRNRSDEVDVETKL